MAMYGYARISTREQTLDLQIRALEQAGCMMIYRDVISGASTSRDDFDRLMRHVKEGDVVVVWKLDRMGRSLKHLADILADFNQRGIGFKSLTEGIDTTTIGGRFLYHLMAAVAEFERDLIRERTNAGLDAARARGQKSGRPSVKNSSKVRMVQRLHREKQESVAEICKLAHISERTFYRYIAMEQSS